MLGGSSELEQVETLVMQVLPDPRGFADRVLSQLLDRLASDGSTPPLAMQFPMSMSTPESPQPTTGQPDSAQPGGPFADRDAELAAALGACLCWGEDPECRTCEGDGFPGWADPDEELYREYVLPVLRRRKASAQAAAAAVPSHQADPEREEGAGT
ncbi:hypothetical protein HP550_15790 [Cellulomonas humilata]|uniref:Uncharacterized protein n=1 Tax=Cellulomonas humilata TaxID=144055 RepID=A0A7Y6A2T3_9CELL|nr:hypothetical protein [Cellulomonas humilata]NUU18716.1 hypothetical protein [Cellulomonas humilata]